MCSVEELFCTSLILPNPSLHRFCPNILVNLEIFKRIKITAEKYLAKQTNHFRSQSLNKFAEKGLKKTQSC